MLVAVPGDSLQELSGITDAIDRVGSRVGLPALGALTGALLALSALGGHAVLDGECRARAVCGGRRPRHA